MFNISTKLKTFVAENPFQTDSFITSHSGYIKAID